MKKSIFESMPTSELDERLQAELKQDVPDGNLVQEIFRVLEEREKDRPMELTPQIQAAWDKFNTQDHRRTDRQKPTARSWVFRAASMAATAAVLCFVLLAVIPQPARAETLWEKLFNFTDSVFQFFNSAEKDEIHVDYVFRTDAPGLQEVYDAVVELGVTEPVVPMWLPDGYELVECTTTETVAVKKVCAWFKSATGEIVYKLDFCSENVWHEYHKDESEATDYEMSGVVHKIMQNKDQNVAVWTKDNVECFLSMNCQIDDFYRILDSIYTAEDD